MKQGDLLWTPLGEGQLLTVDRDGYVLCRVKELGEGTYVFHPRQVRVIGTSNDNLSGTIYPTNTFVKKLSENLEKLFENDSFDSNILVESITKNLRLLGYQTGNAKIKGLVELIRNDEFTDLQQLGETVTQTLDEVSPPGWSGTVRHMKKHKKVTNPFALAWWEYKMGRKSHKKPEQGHPGAKHVSKRVAKSRTRALSKKRG